MQLNDLPLVVKVFGRVDGPDLNLKFLSGGVSHEVSYPLPSSSPVGRRADPGAEAAADLRRPQVADSKCSACSGRPADSLDLVQAEVVAEEIDLARWQMTRAKRIEYRNLSAAGVASEHTLRAVVWVADDGTVLRQDVYLVNTKLRFERRTDPKHDPAWPANCWTWTSSPRSPRHAIDRDDRIRPGPPVVRRQSGGRSLNLRVAAGELYSLLGPQRRRQNDHHQIAGRSAAARSRGRSASAATTSSRRPRLAASLTGYVPDQPFLYDKLTGREFLQFVAQMHGLDARSADRSIDREIERFELARVCRRAHRALFARHEAADGVCLGDAQFAARCWCSTSRWSASIRTAFDW